jgi:cytochrome P450
MTGARPDPTISNNRYRLLEREVLANLYPVYHQMRSADPIYRERRFGWVLTRYDDVAWALRAPHLSAHRPLPHEPVPQPLATIADEVRALRRFQSLWMLYSDPPQHTRLRALVGAAFTPRVVEGMRVRIQQIVDGLIDAVEAAGHMDVIADLAYHCPRRRRRVRSICGRCMMRCSSTSKRSTTPS